VIAAKMFFVRFFSGGGEHKFGGTCPQTSHGYMPVKY